MLAEAIVAISMKLMIVDQVVKRDSLVVVRFEGGTEGHLAGQPSIDDLKLIQEGQTHHWPIVVSIAKSGEISLVGRADSGTVSIIKEKQDSLELGLSQDGIYHLKKNHPDFARLRAMLEYSLRHEKQLWLSLQIDENNDLLVTDARSMEVAPDESKERNRTPEKRDSAGRYP
jgi:hypothetical protein